MAKVRVGIDGFITKEYLSRLIDGDIVRPLNGFDGAYYISINGDVISTNYMNTGRIKHLKPFIQNGGYRRIMLTYRGTSRHYLIHTLVGKTFLPNPMKYPIINHKDENPSNNNVSNLEWCTHKYNVNYGTANNRRSKSLEKKIYQIDKTGTIVAVWDSLTQASESGFDAGHISRCARGLRKTHGGFKWRYA